MTPDLFPPSCPQTPPPIPDERTQEIFDRLIDRRIRRKPVPTKRRCPYRRIKRQALTTFIIGASAGSSNASSVTTSGVTTTGANLIVLSVAYQNGVGGAFVDNMTLPTDNKGNLYTHLRTQQNGDQMESLWCCVTPIIGSSHTFSVSTGAGTKPTINMAAFQTTCLQIEMHRGGIGSGTCPLDTWTPSKADSLLITGIMYVTGTASINSGFTLVNDVAPGANNHGGAIAYKALTSAAATAPTWTIGANLARASMVVFVEPDSPLPTNPRIADVVAVTTNGTSVVSGAINTIGATLIMIGVSFHTLSANPLPTDVYGNTYLLAVATAATGVRVALYYCVDPITGAAHTFSCTATQVSLCAVAFNTPCNQLGATSSGNTSTIRFQPGPVTPGTDNALVISVIDAVHDQGSWVTPGMPFTDMYSLRPFYSGYTTSPSVVLRQAIAASYTVRPDQTAYNPEWYVNVDASAANVLGVIATFTIGPGPITESFAESDGGPFSDDADYYGGYKEARILRTSGIKRALNTNAGGIQASSWTITLDDTDRNLRSRYGVSTFKNTKQTYYVVDHADRIAKDEAYRVAAGFIVDHGGDSELLYELQVDGALGRHTRKVLQQKKVPQNIMTPAIFPALAARHMDGWSPPIGYAELSDETDPNPQGVVQGIYVGTANFQDIFGPTAINKVVDFYVFFGHAVYGLINLYYNLPDTPVLREVVPDSAFATGTGPVWAPFKPNWGDTGLSVNFADFMGFRYTFVAVDNSHALAPAGREGRSLLTGNWYGIEDVGNCSGKLLKHPAKIFQHFWANFVERVYTSGLWLPVPSFGDYGLLDTTRIGLAAVYENSIGMNTGIGILIGKNGKQELLSDVLKDMQVSWDMELGETRHGQIFCTHEDPAAVGTISVTDQHDFVKFKARTDPTGYYNVIRYRYRYRYVPPAAPIATPPEGSPLPTKPVEDTSQWISGLITLKADGTGGFPDAIAANNGEEVPLDLDLYGVRDATVAAMIAGRVLRRSIGPMLEGPINVEGVFGWNGLGNEDGAIDLDTVLAETHIEGLGASGFEDTNVRIREIEYLDLLRGEIALRGRLLTG